jgi:putative DNA primase/helicase
LCGVLVTGDVTEQLLPLFIGVGANGKSVLVDTLLGVLGTYAGLAPPSLLTDRGGGEEHPTELADLIGRRLVVGSETEESAKLKVQLVKRLTGDATIKARFMRCDYFEAKRAFKVLLVTNNKPVVTEAGNAIWRRLRLVPFNVVIPDAEQDRHLLDKLRDEWPGILAWCVRGTLDWQRDGMRTPEAVLLATAEYAAEQDVLADYLAARTVRGGDHVRVGRADLFADYQSWASQPGERHPLARNPFFDRIRKLSGVADGQWKPVGITVPVRGFRGIGLRGIGGDE